MRGNQSHSKGAEALAGDRPLYDRTSTGMDALRGPLAGRFAEQILATTRPFRKKPDGETRVLDVGSGYGRTSMALAHRVMSVVGIEPSIELHRASVELLLEQGSSNVEFRNQGIEAVDEPEQYDLVVLDNVFEHITDQHSCLQVIYDTLAMDGALYLLTPNRMWPIEVHYGLPFLSYLPVPAASRYLQLTGRGTDYLDASYAPTYRSLKRKLASVDGWTYELVLPVDLKLTTLGDAWHYRLGAFLIRRFPSLWAISKSFLVVATKHGS